jgi:WD40 repeat protein
MPWAIVTTSTATDHVMSRLHSRRTLPIRRRFRLSVGLLGRSQVVRQRFLVPPPLVRIQAPQPIRRNYNPDKCVQLANIDIGRNGSHSAPQEFAAGRSMRTLADRLIAVLALAAGVFALWSFVRTFGVGVRVVADDMPTIDGIRLAALLAGGAICLAVAMRLFAVADDGTGRQQAPATLFGRNARIRPASSSVSMRSLLYAIPLIAIAALIADRIATWQPAGVDIQTAVNSDGIDAAPVTEPQPEPTRDAREILSQPPVFEPQPAANSEASKPQSPTPEQKSDTSWIREAVEAARPGLHPAPGTDADQQTAMAPDTQTPPVAETQIEPQTTIAPLPEPEHLPTQAGGHHDAVVWLALAPDGRSLMSASTDRTIKLWDLETKQLIRDVGIHKDMARTALFLPDGKRALTAGDEGEIVLRNIADGAILHVFSAAQHGGANKVALTRDGKRAVSVHEAGTVIVWDIESGSVVHVMSGHGWSISSVAISPDGGKAISGSIDGELKLWDIDAGRLIRSWRGHERGTYGAAFTPDGHEVITGSGDDSIKIWDVETGRLVRELDGHSGTVYALQISPDGKRLVSCSLDGTARLWDIASGDEIEQYNPTTGPLYSVVFAPDGSVFTGGIDRAIRKWPGGEIVFAGAPD